MYRASCGEFDSAAAGQPVTASARRPAARRPARTGSGLARAAACCLVLCLAWCALARGQQVDARREANVKAVFVYSFGRYVSWPAPAAGQPFRIGVIGTPSSYFTSAIDRIAASRKIAERPIVVKRFESLEKYQDCEILFVSGATSEALRKQVVERLSRAPVLIVGETPGFAQQGAVINFYVGDSVRFEINDVAARQRGLKLDAKLLNLGRRISSN